MDCKRRQVHNWRSGKDFFCIGKYDPHRVMNWTSHAREAAHNDDNQFDMIIGDILMHEQGMKIDYRIVSATWDGATRPIVSVKTDKDDL